MEASRPVSHVVQSKNDIIQNFCIIPYSHLLCSTAYPSFDVCISSWISRHTKLTIQHRRGNSTKKAVPDQSIISPPNANHFYMMLLVDNYSLVLESKARICPPSVLCIMRTKQSIYAQKMASESFRYQSFKHSLKINEFLILTCHSHVTRDLTPGRIVSQD